MILTRADLAPGRRGHDVVQLLADRGLLARHERDAASFLVREQASPSNR